MSCARRKLPFLGVDAVSCGRFANRAEVLQGGTNRRASVGLTLGNGCYSNTMGSLNMRPEVLLPRYQPATAGISLLVKPRRGCSPGSPWLCPLNLAMTIRQSERTSTLLLQQKYEKSKHTYDNNGISNPSDGRPQSTSFSAHP